MNLGKKEYVLLLTYVINLLLHSPAKATIFFAKQYGVPCSKCHDKVPTLKEFGSNFKKNGYSFDKKPVSTTPPPAYYAPVAPSPLPTATAIPAVENSIQPTPSSAHSPLKTDYLYSWRSADGTQSFTDNPVRAYEHMKGKQADDKGTTSKASQKKKAHMLTLPPQKDTSHKAHGQNSASHPTAAATDPLSSAGKNQTSVMNPPRNYEECMGEVLSKARIPTDSTEAMAQFEQAEQNCTAGSQGEVKGN